VLIQSEKLNISGGLSFLGLAGVQRFRVNDDG
jgi:hypothetical protein